MRHLVIVGFDARQALQAIAVPAVIFLIGAVLSSLALKARIAAR
jgi:purine-cytosine permease-like protein